MEETITALSDHYFLSCLERLGKNSDYWVSWLRFKPSTSHIQAISIAAVASLLGKIVQVCDSRWLVYNMSVYPEQCNFSLISKTSAVGQEVNKEALSSFTEVYKKIISCHTVTLGLETSYHARGFHVCLSPSKANKAWIPDLCHNYSPSHPFQVIIHYPWNHLPFTG